MSASPRLANSRRPFAPARGRRIRPPARGTHAAASPLPALASHTLAPSAVTIAGSLQSELGCAGDWQPDCAATQLTYDAADDVWQGTFTVPAGSWEYKAPSTTWDENYGLHAVATGPTSPSPWPPRQPSSSTTTTRPTGSPTTSTRSSPSRRAASRASSAAPATGSPTACARGSRTSTATGSTPSRRPPSRPALRDEGRDQRELGRELRGRRRAGRPEHRLHGPAAGSTTTFTYVARRHVLTITASPRRPRARQQHRLGRPPSRLPRRRSTGRPAARSRPAPGDAPVPDVPRRRHGRRRPDLQPPDRRRSRSSPWRSSRPGSMRPGGLEPRVRLLAGDGAGPLADQPDNLWYRFIVTDGTDTDYYGDDTAALDGGLGATTRRRRRPELGAHAVRARLHRAVVGEGRGHVPDLPRPLPQRPQGQRSQDRRHPLRRPGPEARLGRPARGLLPQLRGA